MSLKTKPGHTIDGFKNMKVSDTLVEIIMKMYRDESVDGLNQNLDSNKTTLYNSIYRWRDYIRNCNQSIMKH